MTRMPAVICLLACSTLFLAAAAWADDVPAGDDYWRTPPGGAFHDFGTTPIPADFFFPGSNPFTDQVDLVGTGAIGGPGCNADTVVSRLATAVLPGVGSQDTVPIEIVALDLVSIDPINVVGPGPPQWDVQVGLAGPQPIGSMTLRHAHTNGGNYASQVLICPFFTFTEVGNPGNQRFFDSCAFPYPPVEVTTGPPNGPWRRWTHLVQLPLNCGTSTPNFLATGPHDGPHPEALAAEVDAGGGPGTPIAGAWALLLTALALLGSGGYAFTRRRGARGA